MPNLSDVLKKEIHAQANLYQITPEQYLRELLSASPQVNTTRDILINERVQFEEFSKEYMSLMDRVFHENTPVQTAIKDAHSRFQMQAAVNKLVDVVSDNPNLLFRLYTAYKEAQY